MLSNLPNATGLGLRAPHVVEVLAQRPAVAWWEVHSENYFGGGEPLAALCRLRADYPVSLHGIGLGIGSLSPLNPQHLAQLKQLVARVEPAAVSEHLAWNRHAERYFNDLLPIPRLTGVIEHLVERIAQVQDVLQRPILLENVSSYVGFSGQLMSEAELMAELVRRTGCGLLVDLNNFYVNALNLGLDAEQELARIEGNSVYEIHVAGFEWFEGTAIDTHGAPVSTEVLALLQSSLQRWGAKPVLLERDTNLPDFSSLFEEYCSLDQYVNKSLSNTSGVYA
ncbi:DUF692 domain-containing protein [Chitinibacter fontanus]|uniref:DUF692 domain-containing protein n=1 Tax=Chitinibacter fontanus TaxID=1737446 RepID=A0A7D5ZIR0_9NEIS|nr:DUF692 domain-containing protein [Chitinibacter fontanus]QLI82527.1 DUF692 domain-containing protein [Chitinibacter fontanus]